MSTRKNIYFKNGRVLEAVISLPEGERSDFVERCILYYLDRDKSSYATTDGLETTNKKVEMLNQNYLQMMDVLKDMANVLYAEGE